MYGAREKRKVEALGNRPLSVMPVSLFSTKEREISMGNFIRSHKQSATSCCFTAWCNFDGVFIECKLVFVSLNILINVFTKFDVG